MLNYLRACIVALCLCFSAQATTVIAPSFDELVQQSELVFRGRVTSLKSAWTGEGESRRIATWVNFAVERTLRGTTDKEITLEFIGGEVEGRRLRLAGFPAFEVGERGVFFVENRTGRVCPLMRLRHGRYRVVEENEGTEVKERILRDDYSALRSVEGVATPLGEHSGPQVAAYAMALTLENFETAVLARSAQLPSPSAAQP